ncbi:MAG: cytidine deaminase [Spirochaeta sp.]|jgi:cytidine deaminase|nr:cytidine deaminase [Spirochaeta sp.]
MKTPEDTFQHARRTRDHAYTPYSHFKVGAALHLPDTDEIVSGCNVENVSYGATVCAERTAIFTAIGTHGELRADHLVVVTDAEPAAAPCALCLQVMQEFLPPEFPIHLANLTGIQRTVTLGELLPIRFSSFTPTDA